MKTPTRLDRDVIKGGAVGRLVVTVDKEDVRVLGINVTTLSSIDRSQSITGPGVGGYHVRLKRAKAKAGKFLASSAE